MNDGRLPSPAETGQPRRWSSGAFALATAAGAWLLYLAVALVRCLLYGFRHPFMLMERHALTAVIAVAMAGLLFLVLRRLEKAAMRMRLGSALLTALAPAALLSVINYNVVFVFAPAYYLRDMGMDMHLDLLGEVIHSSIENYFVFAAWAVLYTAVSHAVQTQELYRRAAASEAAARAAELRALRFQLDPHFLFNALNTVSGLVLSSRPEAADRTIDALSSFLRATLATDAAADIPLSDELHLQGLYLRIEQVRFGDRLAVETHVPEDLQAAMVPALILQPLVENSVRHAVARSSKAVRIVATATRQGSTLALTVTDDGDGAIPSKGLGLGLANVAQRLDLRYGGAAACVARQTPGGGFETRTTLPLLLGAGRTVVPA